MSAVSVHRGNHVSPPSSAGFLFLSQRLAAWLFRLADPFFLSEPVFPLLMAVWLSRTDSGVFRKK